MKFATLPPRPDRSSRTRFPAAPGRPGESARHLPRLVPIWAGALAGLALALPAGTGHGAPPTVDASAPVASVTPEARPAAYLGVETAPVDPALRSHLQLPEGVGLTVRFLLPESPAAKCGLQRYDILTRLDDQVLVNRDQFRVLIRSRQPGDKVRLTVLRAGQILTLEAELTKLEETARPRGRLRQDEPHGPDPESSRFDLEDLWEGPLEVYLDGEKQVDIDLSDLREDLGELKEHLEGLKEEFSSRDWAELFRHDASVRRTTILDLDNRQFVYTGTEGKLTLRWTDEGKHLRALGPDATVLYDGPLDEQTRPGLPPPVQSMLEKLEHSAELKLEGEDSVEVQVEVEVDTDSPDPSGA